MDLKSSYQTILSDIEKEKAKIDQKIKEVTTGLKSERVKLDTHGKQIKKLLDQLEPGAAPPTRTRKKKE